MEHGPGPLQGPSARTWPWYTLPGMVWYTRPGMVLVHLSWYTLPCHPGYTPSHAVLPPTAGTAPPLVPDGTK